MCLILDPIYATGTISQGLRQVCTSSVRFRVTDQTLPIPMFRLNQDRASRPAESHYQSLIFSSCRLDGPRGRGIGDRLTQRCSPPALPGLCSRVRSLEVLYSKKERIADYHVPIVRSSPLHGSRTRGPRGDGFIVGV